MNQFRSRIPIGYFIAVVMVSIIVPWKIQIRSQTITADRPLGYSFIFAPPRPVAKIDYGRIALKLLGVSAAGILILSRRGVNTPTTNVPRPAHLTAWAEAETISRVSEAPWVDGADTSNNSVALPGFSPSTTPEILRPKNVTPIKVLVKLAAFLGLVAGWSIALQAFRSAGISLGIIPLAVISVPFLFGARKPYKSPGGDIAALSLVILFGVVIAVGLLMD